MNEHRLQKLKHSYHDILIESPAAEPQPFSCGQFYSTALHLSIVDCRTNPRGIYNRWYGCPTTYFLRVTITQDPKIGKLADRVGISILNPDFNTAALSDLPDAAKTIRTVGLGRIQYRERESTSWDFQSDQQRAQNGISKKKVSWVAKSTRNGYSVSEHPDIIPSGPLPVFHISKSAYSMKIESRATADKRLGGISHEENGNNVRTIRHATRQLWRPIPNVCLSKTSR